MAAIQYVTYQDNRRNGTKLWYGRAVHPTTVSLDQIAERIQQNCSMKKSDVMAVLVEMIETMNYELQNSNKVKLDGLGTFFINLRTKGAVAEDKFNANENVAGFRVKFLAEAKKQNGKFTRTFTNGLHVIKAVGNSKKEENGGE